MDPMRSATSSFPSAPSQGTPLAATKNPLSMSMGTSRFARAISEAPAPASKTEAKPILNRELGLSGAKTSPREKKGWIRNYKQRTPRAQVALAKDSGLRDPPSTTALPAAAVLVPIESAVITPPATPSGLTNRAAERLKAPVFVPRAAAVTPTPSAPSKPILAEASEPTAKENAKVKKEHIVYLQRLHKEGLTKSEIAKRTAAEFPQLCKGMRNGCKTAAEETRLKSVGDAVFLHTLRYAKW